MIFHWIIKESKAEAQTVTYVHTKNQIVSPVNSTTSSETGTKPVSKTTPISSTVTTNTLPQTGESNSPLLNMLGGMLLLARAYILTLKRKKQLNAM